MTRNDRAALKLSMEIAQRDPGKARQLRSMLRDQSWEEVARFASYGCQNRSLDLEPWSMPPCHGDSRHHPDPAARKLLEQMLSLGISRWHPSPLEAIEAVRKVVT